MNAGSKSKSPSSFQASNNPGFYFIDCTFSVLVIGTLVIFVWRSMFALCDLLIYSTDPSLSAFYSLVCIFSTFFWLSLSPFKLNPVSVSVKLTTKFFALTSFTWKKLIWMRLNWDVVYFSCWDWYVNVRCVSFNRAAIPCEWSMKNFGVCSYFVVWQYDTDMIYMFDWVTPSIHLTEIIQ